MTEERSTAVTVVETKEPRISLKDVVKTKGDARAMKDLLGMFTRCRPHDTKETIDFAIKWLKPLGAKMDKRGNWRLRVGPSGAATAAGAKCSQVGESKVLWSSHIDTVDWREGPKMAVLNHNNGVLKLSDKDSNSTCLGADCTTGVWIMREMALSKVPGLYIWHEGEEAGGLGSSWIKNNDADALKGIDAAIAFDRKGFDNIITEQSGGQCCSDAFAEALALQLPYVGAGFKPDPTGTFTDTANYTDIVPECTNLSVGYFSQHFKGETQNVIFAMLMRAAMLRFDESKLVIKRKPGEGKRTYSSYNWGGGDFDYGGWGGYGFGYSSRGYSSNKETVRDYIMKGDTVRILSTAVGHGAMESDVGREGRVTAIDYKYPVTLDIRFAGDDEILNLKEDYACRVETPAKTVTTPKREVIYYLTGDRVRIKASAFPHLLEKNLPSAQYIGKEGKIIATMLAHNKVDIKLDNGLSLWSLSGTHIELIKAVKQSEKAATWVAKEKAKHEAAHRAKAKHTRCGGLCGGKCQGMCKDPDTLDVMKRLAAGADKAAEAEARRKASDAKWLAEVRAAEQKQDEAEGDLPEAHTLLQFVKLNPDAAADWIEQMGGTLEDLYDAYPDSL